MSTSRIRYHFSNHPHLPHSLSLDCLRLSLLFTHFPVLFLSHPPLSPFTVCSVSLQNGLTALEVATASDKGDADGVCAVLRRHMQESATTHSHHVSNAVKLTIAFRKIMYFLQLPRSRRRGVSQVQHLALYGLYTKSCCMQRVHNSQ